MIEIGKDGSEAGFQVVILLGDSAMGESDRG